MCACASINCSPDRGWSCMIEYLCFALSGIEWQSSIKCDFPDWDASKFLLKVQICPVSICFLIVVHTWAFVRGETRIVMPFFPRWGSEVLAILNKFIWVHVLIYLVYSFFNSLDISPQQRAYNLFIIYCLNIMSLVVSSNNLPPFKWRENQRMWGAHREKVYLRKRLIKWKFISTDRRRQKYA